MHTALEEIAVFKRGTGAKLYELLGEVERVW
jgi:hypothetical protein